MTLTLLHSKMFDVGDLPALTFGDCVLNFTYIFCFFQNPKTRLFTFSELLHVFLNAA